MTLKEMNLFDWPEIRLPEEAIPGLISLALLAVPVATVIITVLLATQH